MDEEAREQAARIWASGDYPRVGERLRQASIEVARASGVGPGDRVLDVGSGSGNTCVALARTGAGVTTLDLSEAWWDEVRGQASAAGVEVELVLGDVEDLPFEDASFDAVVSCFAHIFAPDHDAAAGEMARVLRPGGTLTVAVWRDGDIDDGFTSLRAFMPSQQGGRTPDDWGNPGYVQDRFAPHGVEIVAVEDHRMDWSFPSYEAVMDFLFTASGPYAAAREAIREAGRWDEAEAAMRAAFETSNRRADGTYGRTSPYLVAVGRR